jgi:micrococcal nuclease
MSFLLVLLVGLLLGQPADRLYWYAAQPYNVVDGDTVDAVLDLGFHTRLDERLRLVWYDEATRTVVGVDTPEINSRDADERARARAAKVYTENWIAVHGAANTDTLRWGGQDVSYFLVRTELRDSFGRPLGDLRSQAGYSLGRDLLDNGYATVWTP